VLRRFGVVNLAIYRGSRVAVKQLQTLNEENVLRFRHECFLMKNLSHPNVIKLVGVCWDDLLFACCLEYAENGSLEDWLRHTVGGKKYFAPETPAIGKQKELALPPLADVVYKGFNWNGEYNPAEITEIDERKRDEADALQKECVRERSAYRLLRR
jgi:hypothetical protein